MKKSSFWDFSGKPSTFAAPTPASAFLALSLALFPLLGSAKLSPKPGAALAAAAAIKNRKANAVSQMSLDSVTLSDSGKNNMETLQEIKENEEKDEVREGDMTGSDSGIAEGLLPLDENSSTGELNVDKSDEEMDKRMDVFVDNGDESLSRSDDGEFMAHAGKSVEQIVEEKVMGEKDKDAITGQCETGAETGGDDSNAQVLHNQDDYETQQSPPLADSGIETSVETQSSESGATAMNDDQKVPHVDSKERRNAGVFYPPSTTETGSEEKQVKIVEKNREHKKAKAVGDTVDEKEKTGKVENRSARNMGKKVSACLKPLDLAEELAKKDASSGCTGKKELQFNP